MAKIKDIVRFCDEYLEIKKIPDKSFNGLQVEGKPEVKKIALGVSASMELFEKAKKWGGEAILVHHGLLWQDRWAYLRGVQGERVKFLMENGISLVAYHIPLDLHPAVGNNAIGLKKLGVRIMGGFGEHEGQYVGYWGELPRPVKISDFLKKVNQVFGSESIMVGRGKLSVQTVAFISGGAHKFLEEAIENDFDVFIDGETNESRPALAQEAGIYFIAAGHYNTEKFGVMALGRMLEKKFTVETKFIDVPNPL